MIQDFVGEGATSGITIGPVSLEINTDGNGKVVGGSIGIGRSIGFGGCGAGTRTGVIGGEGAKGSGNACGCN